MNRTLFTLIVLLAAALPLSAQSRTNRLYRPCPASTTPATIDVERDGDVTITPCSGRSINTSINSTLKIFDPAYNPFNPATSRLTVGSSSPQVIPNTNNFVGAAFEAWPQFSHTTGKTIFGIYNGLFPGGSPSGSTTMYGAFNGIGETGGYSGTYGSLYGSYNAVLLNSGTLSANPMVGVFGNARPSGGGLIGGGIGIIYGMYGQGGHGYSAHLATVAGVFAETMGVNANSLGSASTDRLMGLRVRHYSLGGDPSFNVVTNRYGIYIGDYATTDYSVLNNYGIYIDSTIDELGSASKYAVFSQSISPSFLSGTLAFDATYTAAGTTGNQTINKPAFSVNFAAAASSLIVTNSFITPDSMLLCTVQTADDTLKSVSAGGGDGGTLLTGNAAATAETKVYCEVRN